MDEMKFACPRCGQHYSAPRTRVGSNGKCGKCEARFQVGETGAMLLVVAEVPPATPPLRSRTPTPVYSAADAAASYAQTRLAPDASPPPAQLIRFTCQQCGKHYAAPAAKAGTRGMCMKCGAAIVVPRSGEATEPSERRAVADRRQGPERRREQKPFPPPDRRSGGERRSGVDRRSIEGVPCPACFEAVAADARICPHCRAPLYKNCPACGEEIRTVAVKCRHCNEVFSEGVPSHGGRRDLRHEGHVSAIAFWFRVGPMAVAGLFLVGMMMSDAPFSAPTISALMVPVAMLAGYFAVGCYLARYLNWARITAMTLIGLGGGLQVLSALSVSSRTTRPGVQGPLVGIQLCTTLVMFLPPFLLLAMRKSSEICSEPYRRVVEDSSDEKPWTYSSPFFYIPAGLLALGVFGLVTSLLGRA